MNLERLRWGEWIAGIAGLDLLLVTFRSWYKITGTGAHVTAWDALHTGRYLLLATAVVGIFLFLIQASEDAARMSFPPGWIAAGVGFACTVYVGYRLASPPSDALDPDVGIYIGLAGALGVTLGGLLSAREAPALAAAPIADETPADTGPPPETIGGLVPDTGTNTWSPASPVPAPATSGWSPASPAVAAVPPATAAGAGLAEEERPLRPGDQVTLTAGGARFPAGTVADVVEVFGGGALVEVKAADGVAERFEVPESAFERGILAPPTGATNPTTDGETWSPALPAAATGDDWGFDEPRDGAATAAEPVDGDVPAEKVPWYKREIGGGKKKKAEMAAAAGAGAAAAAIATHDGEADTGTEEKPSFFKRLFGGGAKQEPATEETAEVTADDPDAETEATAAAEPEAEIPGPEPDPEPEPEPDVPEPEPVASDPEPEAALASEPEPMASQPEPEAATASEPEPASAETEPEVATASEPEPETNGSAAGTSAVDSAAEAEPEAASAPEPVPDASAPDSASEPEPEAAVSPAAPDPGPAAPTAEAASAPEPEPAASMPEAAAPAPEAEPAASSAEPASPSPDASEAGSAAAGAAAGAAAAEEATPRRRRSSGSRKVPKEAVAAAASEDGPPKVGDEVQLKVSGGKFDAGTRGTVVDVFSAGVIVQLSDNNGNIERLDLPFEAVGPADA